MSDSTSIDPSELAREQIQFTDGGTSRVYTHDSCDPMPSVTTVLDTKQTPVKDDSLSGWRNYFDGSSEDRQPHWRDQMHYKGYRGTLVHWHLGNEYGEMPETKEEREAREKLQQWWAWKPSAYGCHTRPEGELPPNAFSDPAVDPTVYEEGSAYWSRRHDGETHETALQTVDPSPTTRAALHGSDNTYDGTLTWDRAQREIQWATKQVDWLTDTWPITEVRDVERYVCDTEWGYAGQFDLLGADETGGLWIGDLKTSSSIDRIGYKLQLAAYAHALDVDVTGLFLFRIDPDDNVTKITTDRDWDRSQQGLTNEFLSLCERTHLSRLPDFNDT